MTCLDAEYRDRKNGMIDYERYRRVAAEQRRTARVRILTTAWRGLCSRIKWPKPQQKGLVGCRASSSPQI